MNGFFLLLFANLVAGVSFIAASIFMHQKEEFYAGFMIFYGIFWMMTGVVCLKLY